MTETDAKYACTTSSIWVCMIEGRYLVAKGHTAWKRKSDAVLAFKNSEYWSWVVDGLKVKNPDLVTEGYSGRRWWSDKRGKELEDNTYQDLLKDETVKYIEIKPIPEWANI